MFEKTKINKKRPGLAHFFKKSSTDHLMELFQFQMESLTAIVRTITHKKNKSWNCVASYVEKRNMIGNQCDQIGRFIGLWANFQSLWQQLFCPNLPHS